MYNYISNALLISRLFSFIGLVNWSILIYDVCKKKVKFVPHLYSRTAGLLLIYSLLIKNGRRITSSTVLFSPVDRVFKGGGGGCEVRIYSCTLLPASKAKVILSNSPLSNTISESALYMYDSQFFLSKCTHKCNKLCSFSRNNLGTTCHRTSLTFSETIYI